MIEFKHYMKSALINSGTPSFREYTASIDKKRLIKFLDGSITELIPEDFGDLLAIETGYFSDLPNVERIEMSDNIKNLYNITFTNLYNIKEVIFSANIEYLSVSCFGLDDTSIQFNNDIVLDFSKAKKVPIYDHGSADGFMENPQVVTIKVPSSLYNDWISSDDYTGIKGKIVAV